MESAILAGADAGALLSALLLTWGFSASALLYTALAFTCLRLGGHHRPGLALDALEDVRKLAPAMAVAVLLMTPLLAWRWPADERFFATVAIGALFLLLLRGAAYAVIRRLRRRGRLARKAVIIGAGEVAATLANRLERHRDHGLVPVGFLDDGPVEDTAGQYPVPLLGRPRDLEWLLRETGVRTLLVAFGRMREAEWIGLMRSAVANDVDIYVVPRFFEMGLTPQAVAGDEVRGIPLQRVHRAATRRSAWLWKRTLDVAVSGLALVVLSPVLVATALAVRLSSPGPVLFRQVRVGQHGRHFELLKFRSMHVEHGSDALWNVSTRREGLTKVGKFIRRTSLDELPQLWNILRGDMSLIGPRPERPSFVQQFSADVRGYGDRHRVPVGLTGWAQVSGLRGDTSIPERAQFDNHYIDGWSPWFDLKILARTVLAVIRDFIRKVTY